MPYYGHKTQLARKRKKCHVSQNAIAAELGISQAAYSNIENGYANPSEDVAEKLISKFELDKEYFVRKEA